MGQNQGHHASQFLTCWFLFCLQIYELCYFHGKIPGLSDRQVYMAYINVLPSVPVKAMNLINET